MDSIFLFTKTGITYENTIETIKKEFHHKGKIRADIKPHDETEEAFFSYGSDLNSVSIYFSPLQTTDDSDLAVLKEEKGPLPFDGYWMVVDYWNEEYTKRVVECLLPLYPEMYVFDDENSIIPGSDYLKLPYQHNFKNHEKGTYYDPNNKSD